MKKHEDVHLRIDPALDGYWNDKKSRFWRRLTGKYGGWSGVPGDPLQSGVCGWYKPKHLVTREALDRVTCNRCLKYILIYIGNESIKKKKPK